MKVTIFLLTLLLSTSCYADNETFSGWMRKSDLDSYFEVLNKGDTASNYFDKGHWISAVEGRWNGREIEYRVIIKDSPDSPFEWWWWINQKHADFTGKLKDYEKQGATLIYAQSFLMPNGIALYQGVWARRK